MGRWQVKQEKEYDRNEKEKMDVTEKEKRKERGCFRKNQGDE